jgi:8-oxo-dGTP pyrophosphatase MutT (NUDIX family)
MLRPADDPGAADWLAARWGTEFRGQLVPSGFEACARLFHPASRDGTPVRWAEIAAHFGTVAHARMEFEPLARRHWWDYSAEPGLFDHAPFQEWLPTELLAPVTEILRRHTSTPDRCAFGIWYGHGDLPDDVRAVATFSVPERTYHLFTGALEDALGIPAPWRRCGHLRPALWWPEDRAWFVGSDTDLDSTYVAGSAALVAELVDSPELEAYAVRPEADFAHRGENVNAVPLSVAAVAVVSGRRLLLVSKRAAADVFYLPGGKPEPGETAYACAEREVREELGTAMRLVRALPRVTDRGALEDELMEMWVWLVELVGEPHASAEIAHLRWYADGEAFEGTIAPAVANHVIPTLRREGLI